MKKNSITLIFLMLMSTALLYAMEEERQQLLKGPLNGDVVIDIDEQQQERYGSVKQQDIHSNVLGLSSLCDMHRNMHNILCDMSKKDKHRAIKKMTTQALMLSCVAAYLPADIVLNRICMILFDGHEKAAERFYTDPSAQALEIYNQINFFVEDTLWPIAPLYLAPKNERDAILDLKRSVIINIEQKRLFDLMSPELKHLYIQGTEVSIKKEYNNIKLMKHSFIAGLSVAAVILLFLVPAALIFTGTPASDPHWDQLLNWAGPVFGLSGGLGLLTGGIYYLTGGPCAFARQMTL